MYNYCSLILRNDAANAAKESTDRKEAEAAATATTAASNNLYPKLDGATAESKPLLVDWNSVMSGLQPPREVDPNLVRELVAKHYQEAGKTSNI